MLKKVLKIIGICIVFYPIGLIIVVLEGDFKFPWLFTLIFDIIFCVILILHEIYGNKPKK